MFGGICESNCGFENTIFENIFTFTSSFTLCTELKDRFNVGDALCSSQGEEHLQEDKRESWESSRTTKEKNSVRYDHFAEKLIGNSGKEQKKEPLKPKQVGRRGVPII